MAGRSKKADIENAGGEFISKHVMLTRTQLDLIEKQVLLNARDGRRDNASMIVRAALDAYFFEEKDLKTLYSALQLNAKAVRDLEAIMVVQASAIELLFSYLARWIPPVPQDARATQEALAENRIAQFTERVKQYIENGSSILEQIQKEFTPEK